MSVNDNDNGSNSVDNHWTSVYDVSSLFLSIYPIHHVCLANYDQDPNKKMTH